MIRFLLIVILICLSASMAKASPCGDLNIAGYYVYQAGKNYQNRLSISQEGCQEIERYSETAMLSDRGYFVPLSPGKGYREVWTLDGKPRATLDLEYIKITTSYLVKNHEILFERLKIYPAREGRSAKAFYIQGKLFVNKKCELVDHQKRFQGDPNKPLEDQSNKDFINDSISTYKAYLSSCR